MSTRSLLRQLEAERANLCARLQALDEELRLARTASEGPEEAASPSAGEVPESTQQPEEPNGASPLDPVDAQTVLEAFLERSPSMIFINQDGGNVFVNRRCAEVLGYPAEVLTSPDFDFRSLIAPESLPAIERMFGKHARGEDVPQYGYTLKTRDGRRIPVINATRLITYRGRPAILGVVTDISEQRRVEEALRASESHYRTLLDTCPDSIVVSREDGTIVMVNQRAAELHGFETPEALLAGISRTQELAVPDDRDRMLRDQRRLKTAGILRNLRYRALAVDGKQVPIEVHVAIIPTVDEGPSYHMAVARDISERSRAEAERRRLEAAMQQAQKLESLGILAGGIAHDFNNLLVGILGGAGLALEQLDPTTQLAEIIAQIEGAASRAAGLTQQLLAYTGKVHLRVEPIELGGLVEEMSDLLAIAVPKHISVRHRLAPALPPVDGDANQLQQVVMNLVINAAEAIGDRDGVITLSVAPLDGALHDQLSAAGGDTERVEGQYLALDVHDTGLGMPEELVERVFDPFVSTKAVGRGLGLAAVQGIVRSHRGFVHVDSLPGRGTVMRVVLPAAADRPSHEREPQRAPPPQDRGQLTGKVLLVDDEAAVRRVVGRMLEHLGFDVIHAGSGTKAVDIYRRHHQVIDIVLLDWIMPNMGGAHVLEALREIRPDVMAVLTSGYDEQSTVDTMDDATGIPFLQKPFDLNTLAERLAQVMLKT